jgi:hypothetical protein
MEVGSGSSVKRYVLRKKPPGKLLQSAHAVEREFQVNKFYALFGCSEKKKGLEDGPALKVGGPWQPQPRKKHL